MRPDITSLSRRTTWACTALLAMLVVALAGQTAATAGPTARLAGDDRYGTSATVARRSFDRGVDTVWVTSGVKSADALSAGARAGRDGGPVLLTAPRRLPSVVAQELRRLKPRRILIAGGRAAVSAKVQRSLEKFAGSVRRVGGAHRYETSVKIARSGWRNGADTVWIANGTRFPDALAGAPAAADRAAPILLSQQHRLPPVVARELRRLDPRRVVLLGGTEALSNRVRRQVGNLGVNSVVRRGGNTRYATAAKVSRGQYPDGSRLVYLASGTRFPDALSVAPVAAARNAPVLLATRNRLPRATVRELKRLRARRVVVLGGEQAIGRRVVQSAVAAIEGFPTPASTGPRVAYSKMDVHRGSFKTSRDGQVIQNMDIRGNLTIVHDNVTVKDSRIMFTSHRGVQVREVDDRCPTGTRLQYVEIDGRNADASDIPLVSGNGCGWKLDHGHVHNVGRSSRMVNNNSITNSYIHSSRTGDSGAHRGGIGLNGGRNNEIVNNTLLCEGVGCSAALAMYGDFAPVRDVLVQHNLFAATAAYCAYGGSSDSKKYPNASDVRFIDNHFSNRFFSKCGRSGPIAGWERGRGNVWRNNVWHESGAVIREPNG